MLELAHRRCSKLEWRRGRWLNGALALALSGRFPFPAKAGSFRRMSTITAILERDADGTLHLPLPADAPRGKLKVTATLESISADDAAARQASWQKAMDALRRLAARGGIRSIPDPVAWQREMRKDRPLPGREE